MLTILCHLGNITVTQIYILWVLVVKDPRRKTLGQFLTEARESRGLTRKLVAEDTGISANSLFRYERAGMGDEGHYPTAVPLAKLCSYYGASPVEAMEACLDERAASKLAGLDWNSDPLSDPTHLALMDETLRMGEELHFYRRTLAFVLERAKIDDESYDPALPGFLHRLRAFSKATGSFMERLITLGWSDAAAVLDFMDEPGTSVGEPILRERAPGHHDVGDHVRRLAIVRAKNGANTEKEPGGVQAEPGSEDVNA